MKMAQPRSDTISSAAGISVAIITVVQGLGTKLTNTFSNISSMLN